MIRKCAGPPVFGPYVFADNVEFPLPPEQQGFLQGIVEAANRFLRSPAGRLLLTKFITVVSDGFEKEEEDQAARQRPLVLTPSAFTAPVIIHAQVHAALPSFLSLAEKFGAAEVLIKELLDGETNQIRGRLALGIAPPAPSAEPHDEINIFTPPPRLVGDSWKSSFLSPLVCLAPRWAQHLTNEKLSQLTSSQLSLLRFSIYVTLIFQFAHLLLPFAVMFHKKSSMSELFDRGPALWQSEKRPSPDPTPERMGLYLKTVGREAGDVLLHLWLGAPLRPSLQTNAANNKIVVFLPFGLNPLLGKFLWPSIEPSEYWLQLDDFFASGGRNNIIKQEHRLTQETRESLSDSSPWYRKLLCCPCLQPPADTDLGLEITEVNLFAEMRRMLPDTARRKIELWQEITDEQPVLPLQEEVKDTGSEPLLDSASPVKTWPPRSPRAHRFAIKKSMISIPTVPSIEESEED